MKLQHEVKLRAVFASELAKYEAENGSLEKWYYLERLHIVGQSNLYLHFRTHWLMLNLAIEEAKEVEILGQVFRLLLVFPGHLLRRLPVGNVGTTRVNAFQRMEVPKDLQELFNEI